MPTIRHKLESTSDFVIGVELVSTRGMLTQKKAARVRDHGLALAAEEAIDWVSITDNAGGNPMLGPAALGKPVLEAGKDVMIHLSCKDFNRNGLESEAWLLASEGFHNILALSGDYPVRGIAGNAKPVFDTDSVGLLTMLQYMNNGLMVPRFSGPQTRISRLAPTQFFLGAVTTNFKLHENEVVPQYLKLEQKIASGARFIINQIGYDSRKVHEQLAWMRYRMLGHVPLIGNVFVLNPSAARLFREQKIPGVVISDELHGICQRQSSSPDKGKNYFLELAAKQLAVYRGLGYRGGYIGGLHHTGDIATLLAMERAFAPDDWKAFAREISFSRPGEFYFFDADPESGLCREGCLNPEYEKSLRERRPTHNVDLAYRTSKWVHDVMFTPGRGLWNVGRRLCQGARDPMQGPKWMRAAEHVGKAVMFGCKDCGDCSLPDIAFLCPESACAKNQRNGPCGGTRDGKCEVDDFECIWSRAYDRLKYEGREQQMLEHAPVIQDQALRGTSSWANTWLERDHTTKHDIFAEYEEMEKRARESAPATDQLPEKITHPPTAPNIHTKPNHKNTL
jgi:methylenetetrahydrofolate reductase (NADPH)